MAGLPAPGYDGTTLPTRTPMPSADSVAAYARSSGAFARGQGRPITDNTYRVHQVGHAEWIEGWNAGPEKTTWS
jgi:hypothetical protein